MADLPRTIVLKPNILKTYVCYESGTERGHVYARGGSVFNPMTKIEIEPSNVPGEYFHLRFCHSNRYLGRCAGDTHAVSAVYKQPGEDTSKISCTLFRIISHNGASISLVHYPSELIVLTDKASSRLSLGWAPSYSDIQLFTYLDSDEVIMLPNHVAFKGHNGKYLKAIWCERHPYLRFESTERDDLKSVHVVTLLPDGHLRIKSAYHGKFWRRSPNWIWADSTDDSANDVDTLFWPKKVDDRTIVLRNEGNGYYVKGLSVEGKWDCLNASERQMNQETKLVVEEVVTERSIYNVRYRLEDARVFDEQPYLVAVASADNYEDGECSLTLSAGEDITTSSSFTRSGSLKIGIEASFSSGIPRITEAGIKVSAEISGSLTWGAASEETHHIQGSFTIPVPPKTRAASNYVATKGTCSVPFTYTQKQLNSFDSKYEITHHEDGIFYGVSFYSFRFERVKLHPL